MKIYELQSRGLAQRIELLDADTPMDYLFVGTSKRDGWTPEPATLISTYEPDIQLVSADIVFLMGGLVPALNDTALAEVGGWLSSYGELLPQPCHNTDQNWWVFNPTTVIDCLDESNSVIKYYPDGRIRKIQDFAFDESRIGPTEIFKLASKPLQGTYVTEAAIERLEATGLRIGVNFNLLWDGQTIPRTTKNRKRYGEAVASSPPAE